MVRDDTVRGYLELLREVTVDERVLLLELLMHLRRVTQAWAHTGTIPRGAP